MKIEIIGIDKATKYLNSKNKQATSLAGKAVNKASIHVQGEVKMSIAGQRPEKRSVDTGRFLNSVDFSVDEQKLMAWIFSPLPYAKWLEYGKISNAPRGRRHFTNTSDREREKVRRILDNELSKL